MRAAILTILFAALAGGGGVYLWTYYGGVAGEKESAVAFIDAYGDYAEIADRVDLLVHLPGTQDNIERAELEQLLTTVLTSDLAPERRDTLSRLAYQNLDVLKKEVDAAQAAQAELYERLQVLDNTARTFQGTRLRTLAQDVVTRARMRAELTSRITSILSETNEHTHAILTQILEDDGELTQLHIAEINTVTEAAEARHARTVALYDDLVVTSGELQQSVELFVRVAL